MATDPIKSVAPEAVPEVLKKEIADALASGLGNFSLRELLGMT